MVFPKCWEAQEVIFSASLVRPQRVGGWGHNFIAAAACMGIGNSLIYMFGLSWLGAVYGWDEPLLSWVVLPFLWGDLFKMILAAIIMPLAWK